MAPHDDWSLPQLPLIPKSVLRRFKVDEPFDTRFRSCARLLQAIWREAQGLPMGTHRARNGRERRIGSLLSLTCAETGRNFLSPAVAHLVRREVVYQETGALIDQRRLYGNLLSSMPLAFNLFAPLRFNRHLAAKVIRSLIPDIDLAKVLHVWFEHSPGRLRDELTGDRTAFDVAIVGERSDGEKTFIGIEQKYSESGNDAAPDMPARFSELAASSKLFKHPNSAVLRTGPCQQLFREHLLAHAAKSHCGYAEARFVLVAPRHNHLVQQGAELYSSHLAEPGGDSVPFINIELEQVIEALGWAGELDLAHALFDRYCNFWKLDTIIDDALRAKATDWTISVPPLRQPLALVSRAAGKPS